MRILLVAPESYHDASGRRARRVRETVAGLVQTDHTAEVATVKWWDQGGSTHHDRFTTHHAVGRSRLSAPRLARRVRSYDPDVVHLVDVPPSGVLASSIAGHAPIVYEATELGGPLADTRIRGPVDGAIDRVIVPSEVVATELLEAGLNCPIEPIPDPIRLERIRSVTPTSAGDVVWHARSLAGANLDDLLLALAESDQALSATVFVHEDADRARDEARTYGMDDAVEVIADATDRERLAVYRGATTYVHTADRCAFASELLWAMAAGCIGVVTMQPHSSAHELVTRRPRDIRVSTPSDLVDGLAAATDRSHKTVDPSLGSYDVGAVVGRLVDTYQRAVSRSG